MGRAPAQVPLSMSVLQDLPAVSVGVRPLPDAAAGFGLEAEACRERMQAALAGSGVRLVARPQPGVPELRVTIRLARVRGPSHLYAVDLELVEIVTPRRTLSGLATIPATTWSRSAIGIANGPDTVLQALDGLLERFVRELAGAQPAKPAVE